MYLSTDNASPPIIANNYAIDEDGFLLDAQDWDISFSEAVLENITSQVSLEHLKVIYFIREKVLLLEGLPPLRLICRSTGLDRSEFKNLFGSCINLWKAAGLPKPDDEIRSHMN